MIIILIVVFILLIYGFIVFTKKKNNDLMYKEIAELHVHDNTDTVKTDIRYEIARKFALERGGRSEKNPPNRYLMFKMGVPLVPHIIIVAENSDGTTALTMLDVTTYQKLSKEMAESFMISSTRSRW
uniref:hypothetical protein n=1 Tax=Psychrobacter sp. TaxID=56811 RepID=UPI0015EFAE97|nr:hypothetical protein [Psychrobacter sp.]